LIFKKVFVEGNVSVTLKHIFLIVTGYLLMHLNYGFFSLHILFCAVFTWVIMKITRSKSLLGVITGFVFNYGFLLLCYYYYATEEYDILITTPLSVLCLRLIA
jgi:lysophospholipid acyltransferase 5